MLGTSIDTQGPGKVCRIKCLLFVMLVTICSMFTFENTIGGREGKGREGVDPFTCWSKEETDKEDKRQLLCA